MPKKAKKKNLQELRSVRNVGWLQAKAEGRDGNQASVPLTADLSTRLFFSFSLSKTLLNPTNSYHMVNITVQVFRMNKNAHLLSLVRMWEYSRMRTSVRMTETDLHTCRGEPGITQNPWNTKGNNLFYLTVRQRRAMKLLQCLPAAWTPRSSHLPFPVTTWKEERWLIFCQSRCTAQTHRNRQAGRREKKEKKKSLEFR